MAYTRRAGRRAARTWPGRYRIEANPMQQVVFIQVTDTHFGPQLLNRRFGWIKGYREHDATLLTAFQAALRDVRRVTGLGSGDQLFLLHTGDLTASGAHGEFAAAELYFRGERPVVYTHHIHSRFLGLRLPNTAMAMIPGNHDHWDGRLFRWGPYNQRIFGDYFPPLPWCRVLKSWQLIEGAQGLSPNVVVELYAVDSNSGMRDLPRIQSVLAQGSISRQEFARLEERLLERQRDRYDNARVVRAFVVHHPLAMRRHNPLLKALDPQSVQELLRLAADYDVFAVLDGHTHRFYYHSYDVPGAGGRQLHELRSATTLQGPADDATQGFIAHQVLVEGGRLVWKAWQYKFVGGGFACAFIQPGDQPWWQRAV